MARGRSVNALWILVVPGVVVVGGLILWAFLGSQEQANSQVPRFEQVEEPVSVVEHDYVIPAGTAERVARGENVNVLPSTMDAQVGDLIRLRNEDSKAAYVGPFYVPVGETVTMRITSPGVLEGLCTAHPDSQFTIRVRS